MWVSILARCLSVCRFLIVFMPVRSVPIGLFSQAWPLQLTSYDAPPGARQHDWCLLATRTSWRLAFVPGVRRSVESAASIYTVRHKKTNFCPHFCQILIDFINSFTPALRRKLAIKRLLNIPPSLNCVATLPCEIQMYEKITIMGNKRFW